MYIIIISMYVDTFFVILTTIDIFHCTHTYIYLTPSPASVAVKKAEFQKTVPLHSMPPSDPGPISHTPHSETGELYADVQLDKGKRKKEKEKKTDQEQVWQQ